MNRIRAFTTDIAGRTRQAAPVPDMHPAPPAPIHIYNTLPPRKAVPKRRVNMDHVTAKLDAVIKSAPTTPAKQAAVEYQPPERPSFQQQLAEMNKRNYEYWFGAKR
jgi:hypothetical protein